MHEHGRHRKRQIDTPCGGPQAKNRAGTGGPVRGFLSGPYCGTPLRHLTPTILPTPALRCARCITALSATPWRAVCPPRPRAFAHVVGSSSLKQAIVGEPIYLGYFELFVPGGWVRRFWLLCAVSPRIGDPTTRPRAARLARPSRYQAMR